MLNKTIGFILLFVGLAIIIISLVWSYNIFSGHTPAPEIFKIEEKEILPTKGLEGIIQDQLKILMPTEFLPKILNLLTWSIFIFILVTAGSKISGLGIQLLRRLKEE